jgi:hypothetical protein
LAIAGAVLSSSNGAKAFPQESTPAVVASSSSTGAVAYLAGGVIGVAAALCVYDLVLKINGLKTWDGKPIRGKTPAFP